MRKKPTCGNDEKNIIYSDNAFSSFKCFEGHIHMYYFGANGYQRFGFVVTLTQS